MTKTRRQSLLWSFSASGLDKGYIFGTMHVKHQSAFKYANDALSHIATCNIYAAEMNLEGIDRKHIFKVFSFPDGKSIMDYVSERKYQKIANSLHRSFGIVLDQHKHRLPFLLTSVIAESVLISDQKEALDPFLWNQARTLGKVMRGLESFEEQIAIMQQVPIDAQIKMLSEIARKPDKYRKQILRLTNYYEQGLATELYKTSKKQLHGLRKTMLYQRNQVMCQRLLKLAGDDSVFAAIGAAHLFGGKGILRLLRKQGFDVKPVNL
ncbi:MAG: TraB/GumN family protein [Saprospiraceae bacterium]|nr:TraB/GumN family protein [Saprospiraceae bacterium]